MPTTSVKLSRSTRQGMRHARELYYYCENCKAVVLLGSKGECSTCGGLETRLPTTDELLIAENEEGVERGY